MHAYAADDPVFVAMNERGQRETNGQLGDFCVKCHAPMALALDETSDGLNIAELPSHLRGVTCAYCHQIDAVVGSHNAALQLNEDGVMRGGIQEPIATGAHSSAYSNLHDRNDLRSSDLCGSCHDVVTPAGVHLERTYEEWQSSIFAEEGVFRLSCGNCHARGYDGRAADLPNAPERRVHRHGMAGVDIALTDFPDRERQRAWVNEELAGSLYASICVGPLPGGAEIVVLLDNVGVGHSWPSGAAHDRRAWSEVIAYANGEEVFSSGVVADDQALLSLEDPYLFLLRDTGFNAAGEETHMIWDITSVESNLLTTTVTTDPLNPAFYHYKEHRYPVLGAVPDRITLRERIRPMGLDVIDDLIESGDLDPQLRSAFPTFDLESTVLEWRGEIGDCVESN
tara:strand:- start:3678 stop:4868 length:1191 start_codon:yes stop_codon:yes gene_type:complete